MSEKTYERTPYAHTNFTEEQGGVIAECALLWASVTVYVDRFWPKIVKRANSTLFGFADVTIVCHLANGVCFPFKQRGILVKELKAENHIDMPSDLGADKEWYEHYMPRSAAGRIILTTAIFQDQQVIDTIAEAAAAPNANADGADAPIPETSPDNTADAAAAATAAASIDQVLSSNEGPNPFKKGAEAQA